LFPLPFLLTGLAVDRLARINKLFLSLAVLLYFSLVAVNLRGIPFRYEPNRQLDQTKKVAQKVFDEAKNKPFNFALITGGNSDHAYRYFLEIWGNSPIMVENDQIDPERKTVTDQLFVVCEISCSPLGHPLWEIAGFGRAEIEGEWEVAVIKVYKLGHWQGKDES
jgi:hypothetical protein